MFSIQFTQDRIADDEEVYFRVLLSFKDENTSLNINLDGDNINNKYKGKDIKEFNFRGWNGPENGVKIYIKDDFIIILAYADFGKVQYNIKYSDLSVKSLYDCFYEWIDLYSKTISNFKRDKCIFSDLD